MDETALIVAVPAVEGLVGRFREKYDPAAADGVPAHVTLVYPFLAPDAVGASDVAALTTLFASARPFDVVFARCRRFEPKTLWLAPVPDAPFRELTARIVAEGLATLSARPHEADGSSADKILIVRGASNLLEDVTAASDLQRVRTLFDDIERKSDLIALLELARGGEGVRIFIGSENKLFSLSGSSIVAAPYADAKGKVVGVIGVIGPTRLNYARIVPIVDYTARVVGRLLA